MEPNDVDMSEWASSPEEVRKVLDSYRVVAVVGLSPSPDRPSYGVARYLMSEGYRIIPVRPAVSKILGEHAYPDLKSIPATEGVEIVDVFRRSEHVLPIAREAIDIGAKVLWMQDGVISSGSSRGRGRQALRLGHGGAGQRLPYGGLRATERAQGQRAG